MSIALACLLSAGCGISSNENAAVSSTTTMTTASDAPSTTAGPTTTNAPSITAPPTTTAPTATPTTATPGPAYGSPCELGSHPDCIDPDGDGGGVYLRGGALCMDELAPTLGPGICTDLDGDGRAGYPDAG